MLALIKRKAINVLDSESALLKEVSDDKRWPTPFLVLMIDKVIEELINKKEASIQCDNEGLIPSWEQMSPRSDIYLLTKMSATKTLEQCRDTSKRRVKAGVQNVEKKVCT